MLPQHQRTPQQPLAALAALNPPACSALPALPSPACPPAPAGNVKGLFGLLACFLPGGGSKAGRAATNDKKAL
jgi:hypothetical protein